MSALQTCSLYHTKFSSSRASAGHDHGNRRSICPVESERNPLLLRIIAPVMGWPTSSSIGWLFDADRGPQDRLIPRWLFLRALGGIYFSAFFSLLFQIRGLIGPEGILPAGPYLQAVAQTLGHWQRLWYAPTLLWWSSSTGMLTVLCWVGIAASLLLVLNLWPRGMLAVCFVCFL